MTDFEVYLSLGGETRIIGQARSNHTRGKETVLFEYADERLRALVALTTGADGRAGNRKLTSAHCQLRLLRFLRVLQE